MKKLLLFFTFLSAIALWTHADVVAFVADGFTYSGTGTNVTIKNNSSNNIAGESFSNNDVTITFESANYTKVTVNSNLVRWYTGDILHFTHTDGVTIENIKVNCSSCFISFLYSLTISLILYSSPYFSHSSLNILFKFLFSG